MRQVQLDIYIGNARTALFNYLFAKHYDGDFVVRIEDTDSKRNLKMVSHLNLIT